MNNSHFKVLIIFGTRPEAIKMAPVVIALKEIGIETAICLTAQHRGMLDQVMDFFQLKADFDLNLMKPNQTLNGLASTILSSLDAVLDDYKPNLVLVHGDTTTSSMSALAAFHKGVPVGHVEAGLRTYNKKSPFPEEMNRQLTGRIADYHFAPTINASQNLLNEGIPQSMIIITGNTVIDALFKGLAIIDSGHSSNDLVKVRALYNSDKKLILITGHRRENFGQGFEDLCNAIKTLSQNHSDVDFIYPVHLNPNVQEPVNRILKDCNNVHLIAPIDYPAFIYLMKHSYFILTDSGGVQEEAPSLGKPVLVMRNTTERPEGIEAGTVKLTGTESLAIVKYCELLLNDTAFYSSMTSTANPYGDGTAAKKIAQFIKDHLA